MENKFLPICREDMIERGWEECDFVLVTGDAYVDHHSFGTAIISRVLEHAGYKVGIIAQPNWKTTEDFMKLGRPRLGFLVNGGNMDPMVNHYSVSKRQREKDLYSPGGEMGHRPDRATIVYCNRIREAYGDIPLVIGGIEASLRRFAHYDYWSDQVRKSILVDSGADLLVYGMSERQIVKVADAINDGFDPKYISFIDGTCYMADSLDEVYVDYVLTPSFEEIKKDLKQVLSERRYEHSIGVMNMAEEFAKIYKVDIETAKIAGLLHDNAKEMTKEEMLKYVEENNIEITEFEKLNVPILHGKIGADIAKKKYGVSEQIAKAIEYHTTTSPKMDTLAKIIYVSDKVELTRKSEKFDIESERKLATIDLDKAVLLIINNTTKYLIDNNKMIATESIETRNKLLDRI